MSEQQFQIALIAIIAKATLMVASVIGGLICIYLGWRLYVVALSSHTKGELELGSGIKLRLIASGPGVFFLAFGSWLIVHVVDRELFISGPATAAISRNGPAVDYNAAIHRSDDYFLAADITKPVAKVEPAPTPPPCAMSFAIKWYTGGVGEGAPPSPQDIEESLQYSVDLISRDVGGSAELIKLPVSDPRMHTVMVLSQMKRAIVR